MVDCGLFQGSHFCEPANHEPFPYDLKKIEGLMVTHSHLDHIGRIPKLVKEGFRGKIYGTGATLDFAYVSLLDTLNLLRDDERYHKEALFSAEDIEEAKKLFTPVSYGEEISLSENMSFIFHDAGHILGSSFIEVRYKEGRIKRTVVFSGDLGNPPTPLLNNTETIQEVDYLLVESAYGDRLHEGSHKRKDLLEDAIEDVVSRNGVLLIPSFALERTQELLYELNDLVEHRKIPKMPVFVDSPLAIKITEIYKKHPELYNKSATYLIKSGDEIFDFPGLQFTPTAEDSKKINFVPPPKIIIAGSGMLHGGRIAYHLMRYLGGKNNTLLFIGFQVAGSLGRRLLEGEKVVTVMGEKTKVNCKIKKIEGYSAHADKDGLLRWVEPMRHNLKKVFVVQGEENAALSLAQTIKDNFGVDADVPLIRGEVELK